MYGLRTRPSKNRKGGPGKDGVEVYTVPSMKAHFQLTFACYDLHSDVHFLELNAKCVRTG